MPQWRLSEKAPGQQGTVEPRTGQLSPSVYYGSSCPHQGLVEGLQECREWAGFSCLLTFNGVAELSRGAAVQFNVSLNPHKVPRKLG